MIPSDVSRLRRLKYSPSVLKNEASKTPGSTSHAYVLGSEEN